MLHLQLGDLQDADFKNEGQTDTADAKVVLVSSLVRAPETLHITFPIMQLKYIKILLSHRGHDITVPTG